MGNSSAALWVKVASSWFAAVSRSSVLVYDVLIIPRSFCTSGLSLRPSACPTATSPNHPKHQTTIILSFNQSIVALIATSAVFSAFRCVHHGGSHVSWAERASLSAHHRHASAADSVVQQSRDLLSRIHPSPQQATPTAYSLGSKHTATPLQRTQQREDVSYASSSSFSSQYNQAVPSFDTIAEVGGVIASMQTQQEADATTIRDLRSEVHTLISELKARDRELNDMSQAHAKQKDVWVCCCCSAFCRFR